MNEKLVFEEALTANMSRRLRVKEIVHSSNTEFQRVDIVETDEYGRVLYLDRRFQTSEAEEFFYHESLVHPAMIVHSNPERVLIVGGGDGGALEEVLKYKSVSHVQMVELDGEVTKLCQRYLSEICGEAFEDPRVELIIEDGRKFMERTSLIYDVIILDLTDPMEPSKYVYTKEFYSLCKGRLKKNGVISLHNDSPFFYPEAFNVITKTLRSVFPYCYQFVTFIPGYLLDFAFAVCSLEPVTKVTSADAKKVIDSQNVGSLKWYNPQLQETLFTLPLYAQKILEKPCEISTDANPYVIPGI